MKNVWPQEIPFDVEFHRVINFIGLGIPSDYKFHWTWNSIGFGVSLNFCKIVKIFIWIFINYANLRSMNLILVVRFLIAFGFYSGCTTQKTNTNSLRFVHVLWRHGDRSPANGTFPTDTGNPESSWPQGWGELTTKGIRQQFQLGRWLRRRYCRNSKSSTNF